VIEQTGDTTTVPSSLEEGTTMIINPQNKINKINKINTDEIVQERNDVSDFEEGYPIVFVMDEDEIPNHDQASYQEEDESLDKNDTPDANVRPIRQTKQYELLTFDFNSKHRQ
jgi:hypothetical protein